MPLAFCFPVPPFHNVNLLPSLSPTCALTHLHSQLLPLSPSLLSFIDFFILSMSALLSPSPLVTPTSLFTISSSSSTSSLRLPPSFLLLFFHYSSLSLNSFPSLLPFSSSLPEVLAGGPSLPIYIGINLPHHTATSQLFLFFKRRNPFSHQPQELIKHSYKLSLPPLSILSFFSPSLPQCQMMDGWWEWVPAVM